MGEALDTCDAALAARFESVAAEIWSFRPREPHHHPNLFGGEASIPFELILLGVAGGREAIDLAIGEGLCALEDRDALMDLGYSKMTDYARENLGLPSTTARDKAKLARTLERLGMSRRAFEQRAWLERRMEELPQLRYAFERGEVSYEKARLVAGVADFDSVNGWIRRATGLTCADLEAAVDAARDAQVCARGRFEARVPEQVAGLVSAALRAASQATGEPLDPAAALVRLARHFVSTWGPLLQRRSTPSRRVQERDGWRCTTPGCTRPSAQDHHVVPRSQGGGNGPENQTALCAPHHLRGIHGGRIRVSGTAPDRLDWELRSGAPLGGSTPRRTAPSIATSAA